MKSLQLLTTVLLLISLGACQSLGPTVSKQVYDEYVNNEDFSKIIFPPDLVLKFIEDDNQDQKDVLENSSDIRVFFYSDEEESGKNLEYFNDINERLLKNDFEELMTIHDSGSHISMRMKQDENVVTEFFVLVYNDTDFIFLNIDGKIDLGKLAKVAGSLDFTEVNKLEGFDPLENFDF